MRCLPITIAFALVHLTACVSNLPPPNVLPNEVPFAADIRKFFETDQVSLPEPCQVLFVGSSSIVKWTTLASDMAPLPVINRGFGGSQIADIAYWFDRVVTPYYPRAIVFYAGENDIAAGMAPEKVVADFSAFMGRKVRALGDVPVYFISLKPSVLRLAQLGQQSQVNEAIRQRASERRDLRYIDVVPLMLENGQPRNIFAADNLHMNAAGYALWTDAVRSALLPETDQQALKCQRTIRR
jgi:lysophospholipase L1-like esterase